MKIMRWNRFSKRTHLIRKGLRLKEPFQPRLTCHRNPNPLRF